MSWLASIVNDETDDWYIHVAHDTLDDDIYIEIGDKCEPGSCISIPHDKAKAFAAQIAAFYASR